VRKMTIEHAPVRLPSRDLSTPKTTARKMQHSMCRLCRVGESEARYRRDPNAARLTRHHLVPESWFLKQPEPLRRIRNAHANIIPLCRHHHDLVESKHPVIRLEARRLLRMTLTQQEIAFAIQVRDREWLDSEYPRQ
jgi:hypothetical protein